MGRDRRRELAKASRKESKHLRAESKGLVGGAQKQTDATARDDGAINESLNGSERAREGKIEITNSTTMQQLKEDRQMRT